MIHSIIFDFGGVIIDVDYNLSFQEVSKILATEITREYIPEDMNSIFMDYEKGLISVDKMIKDLEKFCNLKIESTEFVKAWNAMLLGIPKHRLRFLEELRKNKSIYLLSNTNTLHIDWVYQHLNADLAYTNFEGLFEKVYYSHKIHLRKPNKDIFEYVLQDLQINPAETLFIDDSAEHIQTAKSLGIHAMLHDPETDIQDVLPIYLSQCS
jgi:putative hydrolase of the HAD superfamily